MSFELARTLRRLKPEKITAALDRRPDAELPFTGEAPGPGRELLLDTTVYIDVLQGRTPAVVDDLLRLRLTNHSSVVLSELTYLFGRLDPEDARTPNILRAVTRAIDGIPSHRLRAPSVRAAGEAGMLAGVVGRLRGSVKNHEQATLNDALLYAQAIERGLLLLTRNIREFDLFDQLWPAESVLFYRIGETGSRRKPGRGGDFGGR